MLNFYQAQGSEVQGTSELQEGDLDAMPGMNDDLDGDLLGDFGDDFNILDLMNDGDGAKGMNILDSLEAEDAEEGDKESGDKPPPYIGGMGPGQQPQPPQGQPPPSGGQQQPHDPSRPPPPPYPGQQKQVRAWVVY